VSDDRRSSPRFACDVEAEVRLADGSSLPGRTIDLSFAGVCLVVDSPVKAAAMVVLSLKIVLEWAQSDALAIPAKVVWCTPTGGRYQLGLAFARDMSSVTMARLEVLLQALSEGVDPVRGSR
jgi:Tfp pilus assembly protein PilZ